MSKHPTPKRRMSRARTKSRYSSFQQKAQKRLANALHLVDCAACDQKRLAHTVCPACGSYKGRKVLNIKEPGKSVTTIKA